MRGQRGQSGTSFALGLALILLASSLYAGAPASPRALAAGIGEHALASEVVTPTPPVLLNQDAVMAELRRKVQRRLRRADLEVDAEVKVVVDAEGKPVRHWLTRSTGSEVLDRAIGDVVPLMKFRPASDSGKPVSCTAVIPIRFRTEA
jgi:TonB family protein